MDNAALAAVHGIEAEGLAGVLDLLRRGGGGKAELGDAERAVIVGVEGELRMVVGRHSQRFHGDVLEREKQLGLVGEQEVGIGPAELHHDFRILDLGIGRFAFGDLIFEIEVRIVQNGIEEFLDLIADGFNRVLFLAQALPAYALFGRRFHWHGIGLGGSHSFIEEPLLRDAHKVASQPV